MPGAQRGSGGVMFVLQDNVTGAVICYASTRKLLDYVAEHMTHAWLDVYEHAALCVVCQCPVEVEDAEMHGHGLVV